MSMIVFAFMSFGAIAASNLEVISAYLNKGININLNGSAWQPKDQGGNVIYPITYNDTTYLPVRAVGEALGVEIGWNGPTNTVLIGKAPAATTNIGTSRSNPAPIGTTVNFAVEDFIDNYEGTLKVEEVIRGDKAWQMIHDSNQFNSPPKDGYEYMLAKISISISRNKNADSQVDVSTVNFNLVSNTGKDYDTLIVVEPDPAIDSKLYVGASHTGWAAFQVSKNDPTPLLTYGRAYDGSGGYWFKTTN